MTVTSNIAGCSQCAMESDRCASCTAMQRAFDARPSRPLNLAWGMAQDIPPDAKRVLLALLRKTDADTGFTQIDLLSLAGEIDRQDRIARHGWWEGESHTSPETLMRQDANVARRVCDQLRVLVRADLLETLPALPADTPWLLRYLSTKSKTPEGIVWFRVKMRDQARVWDGLAA